MPIGVWGRGRGKRGGGGCGGKGKEGWGGGRGSGGCGGDGEMATPTDTSYSTISACPLRAASSRAVVRELSLLLMSLYSEALVR